MHMAGIHCCDALLGWFCVIQERNLIKVFLHKQVIVLSHETYHSCYNARLNGVQNGIQNLEPYLGYEQFLCLLTLLPLSSRGYCFLVTCSVITVTSPPFCFCCSDFCHCQPNDSPYSLNRHSQGGSLQLVHLLCSTRYLLWTDCLTVC